MIENWTDLSELLSTNQVDSSAPARLSCGGSTDHRLSGLLCRSWRPVTANIAIDLRARVRLSSFSPGRVLVNIEGVGRRTFTAPRLPLTGPFALVSALVCFHGVHGLRIDISTDFPFQSGLGGSGAVAIALMGAIRTAVSGRAPRRRDYPAMIRTAHHLEDSLFGNTGLQDQSAALYGGANIWEWNYSDRLDFVRRPIIADLKTIGDNILLAYSGHPHPQSRKGSKILERFRETGSIDLFASLSEQARRFADALERQEYRAAGNALFAEFSLRSKLSPVALPEDRELVAMARKARCGVGVTGHGGGGCIWAVGEKDDIARLREKWSAALERRNRGSLIPVRVSRKGLCLDLKTISTTKASAGGLANE